MRAKLYLSVTFDETDEDVILRTYGNEFLLLCLKSSHQGKVTLSSVRDEIEFDDLGESILHYCRNLTMPDLHSLNGRVLAYLQVVPSSSEESELRVYLEPELLRMLGQRGFGLDIHQQLSDQN